MSGSIPPSDWPSFLFQIETLKDTLLNVSEYGSYISSKYSFEWKDVELTRTAGDGGEEDTINGAVRTIHSSMRLARGDHWTAHGRRVPKR